MRTHELLGTTEATWSKTNRVGAVLLTRTGDTVELGLEVKERFLADWYNFNWPGLVLRSLHVHERQGNDEGHQDGHGCESVAITLVEVKFKHL